MNEVKYEVREHLDAALDAIYSLRVHLQEAADLVGEPEGGPCRVIRANLGSVEVQVQGILNLYPAPPRGDA